MKRGLRVVGLDDLSSGRRDNLAPLADHPCFRLVEGDICDATAVDQLFQDEHPRGSRSPGSSRQRPTQHR